MDKKPIIFNPHARYSMRRRGATEREVRETIRRFPWVSAKKGRLECEAEFIYDREWNGVSYRYKKVRPIFVEEKEMIRVITVYTFYY